MNLYFQEQETGRKGQPKAIREGKNYVMITLPEDVDGLRLKQNLMKIKKEIQREEAEMRERHTHADWEMV